MESGRPKAPKPSRLAQSGTIIALILLSCAACLGRNAAAAFASALSAMDSAIASRDVPELLRIFPLAFARARETSEWLSLLKRAKEAEALGDVGRYADTADRARKAFPTSESIAAASALAYMRDGRPADALALFRGPISPDARPNLWAEAFIAARGSGTRATADSADYSRLAEVTRDPRPYLGAAALGLASGDRVSARAWLEKALAGGAQAPSELLWDCGLYEALAARPDAGSGPYELALMGDAAWMANDSGLARTRWERAIDLDPRFSWKPYVDLALMAGDLGETAESYWQRLKAAFLSGPASEARDGALAAYAAHLARTGRDDEALGLLKGGGRAGALAVLALAIEGRSQPEAGFDADFERLAEARADDPEVQGAALRAFAIRGRWDDVALLVKDAALRRLPLAYGWYYRAAVMAGSGDFKGAAAAIETAPKAATGSAGAASPADGLAGSFALGALYGAMGDPVKSAAAFSRAAGVAPDGKDRCAALEGLGRALGDTGDRAGSTAAFKAAAEADPADPEAAMLARGASSRQAGSSEAGH